MLCAMVKCVFGGKKFLATLVVCSGLNAVFQLNIINYVIQKLQLCDATVLAVIIDNNSESGTL